MSREWLVRGGVFLLGALVSIGIVAVLGPRTYEDCILRGLRGSPNQMVAGLVSSACRAKFGGEAPDSVSQGATAAIRSRPVVRDLTALEVAALTGRAGLRYPNLNVFSGTIYNGSDSLTVTEVTFGVRTVNGVDTSAARYYRDDVAISPLTSSDFRFDIVVGDPGSTYSWFISGAKGRTN